MADNIAPVQTTPTVNKPKKSFVSMFSWWKKIEWLQGTSFYPAEFALVLSTSLGILTSVSFLTGILISYWMEDSANDFAAQTVMGFAATLLVLVPIHLVLYWRVRHTMAKLTPFSHRVVNAFLGIYVFIAASVAISLEITLVYTLLSWLFGLAEDQEMMWATILMLGQAALWFKLSAWHFLSVRAGAHRPMVYAVVVKVVVIALVVLALIFPGSAGRATARDQIKVNDLTAIASAIDNHVTENQELPGDLGDLTGLSTSVKSRLSDYDYKPSGGDDEYSYSSTYQLCATFETSTGDTSYSSYSFYYHDKGRECFDRYAGGSYYDYDTQESGLDQLQEELPSSLYYQ